MFQTKPLHVILRQIIKNKKFIFNDKTGYYCINNYDGTFLFEYHPLTMDIITSEVVKKYIKYCKYDTCKIESKITYVISEFFNKNFRNTFFVNESFSEVIKFNRFYDILTLKPHKGILNIPLDYYRFNCIELKCSKLYNIEPKETCLNKQIILDFENIDISDLPSGDYKLIIYVPYLYNGRTISIKILND